VTTETAAATAHWDLSQPKTPAELGSEFDRVVIVETLGRDGVDTRITLPGGDVVTGSFRTVTANTGTGTAIATVDLTSDRAADGAWEERIGAFIERFGGDRAAVDEYLATALPAMQRGEVDPEESFPGDARPGYEPWLQLRPDAEGVVVNWQFDLAGT
jgi:hypothetical protein